VRCMHTCVQVWGEEEEEKDEEKKKKKIKAYEREREGRKWCFTLFMSYSFPVRDVSYYSLKTEHLLHTNCKLWHWVTTFFFFYWRYNPLWVLAFSVIFFHSVLSLHNFLHPSNFMVTPCIKQCWNLFITNWCT